MIFLYYIFSYNRICYRLNPKMHKHCEVTLEGYGLYWCDGYTTNISGGLLNSYILATLPCVKRMVINKPFSFYMVELSVCQKHHPWHHLCAGVTLVAKACNDHHRDQRIAAPGYIVVATKATSIISVHGINCYPTLVIRYRIAMWECIYSSCAQIKKRLCIHVSCKLFNWRFVGSPK